MTALSQAFQLSSPSSSPLFGPVDSSPPSSPDCTPISLDSPPGPSHPFAASSSSNRRPPLYEKKNLPSSLGASSKYSLRAPRARSEAFQASREEDDYLRDAAHSPRRVATLSYQDREAAVWDEAITDAIDNGIGTVELGSRELTHIPPSIGDLGNFYVTPATATEGSVGGARGGRFFARDLTPTRPLGSRSFERTASVKERPAGISRGDIHLLLAVNNIRRLPRELFSLSRLTVLTLRSNKLSYLPPEIALLKNLKELHLSNNQLTYLPAEMLAMTLSALTIHSNPFLPAPAPQHGTFARVSPTTPAAPGASASATNLAERYILPIPGEWNDRPLPPSVRAALNACVPEAVSAPKTLSPNRTPRASGRGRAAGLGAEGADEDEVRGAGVCAGPGHRARAVFVRHVEERFAWRDAVAGVSVYFPVPVKWRGCCKGCLAFLDEDGDGVKDGGGGGDGDVAMDGDGDVAMDGDGDVEMDDADIIQPVTLSVGAFGEEDFEDDA
ncbi:hypothetical protein FIBSPDRAFT_934527 [Athelia psychrophila]|uniref:L domain-like protein n=1 Tax=Athelia psychrophila TaxID=1759441 RepID=A0A166FBE4_9AGAM|nr:hypothetical protein FIBSPDRAFT_934527 [Fibularhizoctonia sp. CBS 109695]